MKTLFLLAIAVFSLPPLTAAELSSFREGSDEQRERLASLEGSSNPPPWDLKEWTNSSDLTLAGLKGKVVVLDFWATWCGPCIASIPHNNQIQEKYRKDVVFIGVCHPRGSEQMKEVVESKGIKYPVAIDHEGETIAAYQVNGFPDYYIFDREGKLVVADCANGKVEEALAILVKD